MENKTTKHVKTSQLMQVYLRKRSKYYEQDGYKKAFFITNKYIMERLFAFALDSIVMFLPIIIWEIVLLMLFSNLISISFYPIIQWFTLAMMSVSILLFNAFLSVRSGGQTLGKYFYDIKIVRKNRHEASSKQFVIREVLGFGLPLLILLLLFHVVGLFAFWLFNGLVVLLHPKHRSIGDILANTYVVVLGKQELEEAIVMEPIIEQIKPKQVEVEKAKNTIDLHIHSNFSDDGELNVEEIFQLAKKKGLKTISICDHNSVKGNNIARRMSSLYHVEYITGVELDCRYEDINLRILGYGIDHTSEIFAHLENESLGREKDASLRRVQLFEQHTGIKVDLEALLKKNRFQKISGAMIAYQVLHNPIYKDHSLLKAYRSGEKSEHPYQQMQLDYFASGKSCYVSLRYPKLENIIDIIKLTGGIPVLSWAAELQSISQVKMDEVLAKGIEGIEVFTPYYSKKEMAKLLKIAKEQKLLVSAGSDFHGKGKPKLHLGDTNCPLEAEKIVRDFVCTCI